MTLFLVVFYTHEFYQNLLKSVFICSIIQISGRNKHLQILGIEKLIEFMCNTFISYVYIHMTL